MAEQLDLSKMRSFYEYDAVRPGRELAHGRLDIVLKELRKYSNDKINEKRILDIGISDGYLIQQIKNTGAISYGADIAFSMLKLVRKNIYSEGKAIFLVQCSVAELPFANNSFDMITACEILEHLDQNGLDKVLNELHRILIPGGLIFITTPYNEQIADSYIKCPQCNHTFPPSGHYGSFNEEYWVRLAKERNFKLVKVKKIYGTDFRLPRFSFGLPLIKLAARIFSVNSLAKLFVVMAKQDDL